MKVDVPTPPDGSPTQRTRRPVPDSIKVAVPMTAMGAGIVFALGWAWNTDKNQALDHQRIDEHEQFKGEVKADLRRFENKIDDLRDLLMHRNPPP